jgi:hypothetical protein
MSTRQAILDSMPVSYWPLDDDPLSTTVRDEMGLHPGVIASAGVCLSAVPFGRVAMPRFDGAIGSLITIPDDDRYSQTQTNALTVACWVCPLALNFQHTDGSTDQYVEFVEKAVDYNQDAEWAMRLYDADSGRPSRMSFYLFNSGSPVGKGAGAYMEHGLSINDQTPVEAGRWLFLVGQGEAWINVTDKSTGAVIFKQGVQAVRSPGDKYNNPPDWTVRPHNGKGRIAIGGSIGKTGFLGGVGHLALWNRLLTSTEINGIWSEGMAELGVTSGRG